MPETVYCYMSKEQIDNKKIPQIVHSSVFEAYREDPKDRHLVEVFVEYEYKKTMVKFVIKEINPSLNVALTAEPKDRVYCYMSAEQIKNKIIPQNLYSCPQEAMINNMGEDLSGFYLIKADVEYQNKKYIRMFHINKYIQNLQWDEVDDFMMFENQKNILSQLSKPFGTEQGPSVPDVEPSIPIASVVPVAPIALVIPEGIEIPEATEAPVGPLVFR